MMDDFNMRDGPARRPEGHADLTPERTADASTGGWGVVVNDVHAHINATRVWRVDQPSSVAAVQAAIRGARAAGRAISIAGGRHAMGGQQFGTDTLLLDMTAMDRVLAFDASTGEVEVEAGITWPALIASLVETQRGQARPWGIIQKQTGADRLSIGGALAANVHGRGLTLPPLIADVVSFTLVDADGAVRHCDRQQNRELFRLAIGGYGLFGVITAARLRLAPRRKVQRVVEVLAVDDLMAAFAGRIADGYLYGDFQFSIDPDGDDFLRSGVFSCYRPVADDTPIPAGQRALSSAAWQTLIELAHVDKRRAVDAYTAHYLATSGQLYWSDTHQLSDYADGYHQALDRRLGAMTPATEIITELYVPRDRLVPFLAEVRGDFRAHGVDVIYGTVRLIERDDESYLAWARQPSACIVFNLHAEHTPGGLERVATAFRRLIDLAIDQGGSFYLTYHRFATRRQVAACYPQFEHFLRLKRQYDPDERFQSDWYRHYRRLFGGEEDRAPQREPPPP